MDITKHWLQQMAEGDEEAFAQLFDAYRRRIYTYIIKVTGSAELAEDAIQDIFLKIWKDRTRLGHVENFNAYLHRMAHNYAYSGFRSMAREELIMAELKKETSPETAHPEQIFLSKEVRAQILELVNQLSPQQRAVFLLSKEAGLKQEEIARKLDISVLTVKKHMGIAVRILREEIRGRYGILIALLINF
ncbi:RNA polymerase sigma-70 factor, ECF subfamily [Filimonas lacunae]|uniref:RNA polymerase sigma-70 factor, ECF subfamily n=1 Tax=Filimonas lacunae TaxID=477680 RepID=A0A1N7QC92_9BACT|nr:RNA polymerase sigma-70 factor, ECF subfamily [Filimonas lacunae]